MIKLTYYDGENVYIAPERIEAVYAEFGATTINCGHGECHSIEEKPEEVVRKIMEYKLAMVRYSEKSSTLSNFAQSDLERLAGIQKTSGLDEIIRHHEG